MFEESISSTIFQLRICDSVQPRLGIGFPHVFEISLFDRPSIPESLDGHELGPVEVQGIISGGCFEFGDPALQTRHS